MNCIHLFNGIGGFPLAAQWMGWNNVASCEIDPFCNKVTGYYWPQMTQHGDIKTTDFTIYRGTINILTGGFPCQPFSMAGKRKGTADDRHLWPEMLRAIREIQPQYVVGENVPGFVNWDGGMVFEQVLSDLEGEGYEVQPVIIPACAVNAPHRRDRIWIIANYTGKRLERPIRRCSEGNGFAINSDGSTADPDSNGQQRGDRQHEEQSSEGRFNAQRNTCKGGEYGPTTDTRLFGQAQHEQQTAWFEQCNKGNVADTTSKRMEGNRASREQITQAHAGKGLPISSGARDIPNWNNFPTQSPVRFRNDGIFPGLDGITFPKWRAESIKAAGNAIVPQVAYQIFKAIAATL